MRVNEINKVALYCSKLSKCEISVEDQMTRLKKYCRHFGLDIVKEYIDKNNDKLLFSKMIEDVKNKEFNIVLSYNFDTLSKNDNDLERLINELDKYKCELHLEDTYKYIPVIKPLFKLPQKEVIEEEIVKKKKTGLVPIFDIYELKNPKTEEPINWVKKFDGDFIRFEDNEIFDSNGEFLGITRYIYVVFKDLKRCYKAKKKSNQSKKTLC